MNILRAIVEQAAVENDDVVLEVGAADGQLTRPLLKRARLVHAFEIDHRYIARLERLASENEKLRVHPGDALKNDLSSLDPPPNALVSNLAYNIAIPLIMVTISELPSIMRWGVMVQKELGDRLFAAPSTKAYSAVSVLVQVSCSLDKVRPVPPSAFRPQPRVDSSFLTFSRHRAGGGLELGREEYLTLQRLVRLAFSNRRKMMTNTLPGASGGDDMVTRDKVREALEALGSPTTARPEELSPSQWVTFARHLSWPPAAGVPDEAGGRGSR
jgi:16S rRNA (adenine1518-N6/adenine1519-N6)-dimethyltransferase